MVFKIRTFAFNAIMQLYYLPISAIRTAKFCSIFGTIRTVVASWTGLWILYTMRTESVVL